MEEVVRQSFTLNLTIMKIIGLYPPRRYSRIYKVYAYTLYVTAMMPPTIFGILHFMFSEDSKTAIYYSDFIMVGMMVYALKLFPFVLNGDNIKKCIHYFDASHYSVLKRKHQKIIEECVHNCQRNSRVFFLGCIAGVTGFIGQVLFREDVHQLPINVWMPQSIEKLPILYYCIYFLLVMGKYNNSIHIFLIFANLSLRSYLCWIGMWNN
jgi:hypothetical protein